jgi:hypothetical protein
MTMLSFLVPGLVLLLALLGGAALALPLQPGPDGTPWRRHAGPRDRRVQEP